MADYQFINMDYAGRVPPQVLDTIERVCNDAAKKRGDLLGVLEAEYPVKDRQSHNAHEAVRRKGEQKIAQAAYDALKSQVLVTEAEACSPLECVVESAAVITGENRDFFPSGPMVCGGRTEGMYHGTPYTRTELKVACREFPALTGLRFPGPAYLETGDVIIAHVDRRVRIGNVMTFPHTLEFVWNQGFAGKSDVYVIVPPQAAETTDRIEKIRRDGEKIIVSATYFVEKKSAAELEKEDCDKMDDCDTTMQDEAPSLLDRPLSG